MKLPARGLWGPCPSQGTGRAAVDRPGRRTWIPSKNGFGDELTTPTADTDDDPPKFEVFEAATDEAATAKTGTRMPHSTIASAANSDFLFSGRLACLL